MSVEYQVQMVYRQEDVAALVKVLEFRRRPEKNLRLARKIGYPIFGLLLLGVGASIIAGIVTTGAFAPITIVTLVLSRSAFWGALPFCAGRTAGNGPTVLGPVPQQGDDLDLYLLQGTILRRPSGLRTAHLPTSVSKHQGGCGHFFLLP